MNTEELNGRLKQIVEGTIAEKNLNSYQQLAVRTAADFVKDPAYTALGLCGEVGELTTVTEVGPLRPRSDMSKVIKESGDVLWYLSVATHTQGFFLTDLIRAHTWGGTNYESFDELQISAASQSDPEGLLRIQGLAEKELHKTASRYAEMVKHEHYHKHEVEDRDKRECLGKALKLLCIITYNNLIVMSDVATTNVIKLAKRYPVGWTAEASVARADGEVMT